ncbi:PREDICTED: membrane-spanning 4-domains subfamily A member 8 [Galeopterus variegatus]|uniref:Membrane-spanning 4-domains subfamily A member 8 n=1 Tax=Galeopterus variegatus TaxID=482537 RepID=A0ABM0RT95_GALVR|nr:PREDICTED: membrane-spanning 4-domains subfamily A member 8 [Galeopterus variegatus]
MSSMSSTGPMANSVFVVAPHSGYPVSPGVMSQVPLYPNNQPQGHLIPGNPPGLVLNVNEQPAQKALKEGKALGVVQILIGLVHIGLGSILVTVLSGYYVPISFYGGFPFWGGIWFIISGSLSAAAENQPKSSCLLNGSVGLNIISAICSAVGIILLVTDISIISAYTYPDYFSHDTWGMIPQLAVCGVLLVFCLLEFFTACVSSHFGCQLVRSQFNNVTLIYPNLYTTNPVVIPEPANLPPYYPHDLQGSR